MNPAPDQHPFVPAPHRTMLGLSVPVLLSLVAEPLTSLVDTAFVAKLGVSAAAALGVGTIVLSATFWVFNFLGIGTQTEIARAGGLGVPERAREIAGLALGMAGLIGVAAAVLGELATPWLARAMGADGELFEPACTYLRIRWIGSPAVLITTAGFGVLRGRQDMRTPLWIALGLNAVNLALDPLLIFGAGPVPALGIAGAAWASVFAQGCGAAAVVVMVTRRVGWAAGWRLRDAARLLVVGRDLFLRTGLLTLFLVLGTRVATRLGPEAGAAHQAIRSVWVFTALLLDAYAMTAQSLVGYFVGALRVDLARRVAAVACGWSFGTGLLLALGMWAATDLVGRLLVPVEARAVFRSAWLMAAVFQPLNALCFATDGIHWGTADYRFLRNAMFVATGLGAAALGWLAASGRATFLLVWLVTGGWITVRALFGWLRIWPGTRRSPLSA